MDGLPRYKKPKNTEQERVPIALDDYLFERKLQEVYDKKQASNDLPLLFKKAAAKIKKSKQSIKAFGSRKSKQVVAVKNAKPKPTLIDSPHTAPLKFARKQKTAHTAQGSGKNIAYKKAKVGKKQLAAFAVLVVGVSIGALLLTNKKPGVKKDTPAVAGAQSAQKPDFDTLLPKNDKDESKIKFDPTRKVATFQDTIEGGRIVVNQQKLGETELKDTGFLRRTSLAFNLTTEVTTKKGQAFIGENRETNTQFAFFIYKDFLFLLQAEKTYKYQVIVDYIDNLQ